MPEESLASRLWQVPDGDLTAMLLACEEKLRHGWSDMLAVVGEARQRGLAKSLGYKEDTHLLTETLRISSREAKTRLEHAAATMPSSSLTGVPQPPPQAATGQALTAGEINREHVQAITAIFRSCPAEITPEQRTESERVLVALARQAGPDTVRKACRRLHAYWEQEALPPANKEQQQAKPLRRMDIIRRQDGSI